MPLRSSPPRFSPVSVLGEEFGREHFAWLDEQISLAQNGDRAATEAVLEQFQPLLRSRMHRLWTRLRETLTTLEWEDVEAQMTLFFLSRLQAFNPQTGVYFAHYIEQMLDLDARAWLQSQRRGEAVPFSQISTFSGDEDNDSDAFLEGALGIAAHLDEARAVEASLGLRAALDSLPAHQREAVWLCCVLGKTETDAAAQLGLPRSTVRNRLDAALKSLRAFFDSKEDGTRTGRLRPQSEKNRAHTARATPFEAFFHFIFNMAKDEKRPDLVGVGAGRPVLMQGTFDFPATGLKTPEILSPKLSYIVPAGCVAGVRYVRAGVVCEKMAVIYTFVNGLPHRLIPVAANGTEHAPFAIVEPILAGSQIEIHIAADAPGTAIVDVGILQMPA